MPRWEASLAAKGLDFQKSPSSDFIWRDLLRLRRSRPLVASLQRSRDKGPYRTNSGTTSVQTRLATRSHGSVTFIYTVTPRLSKLTSGSNKDALMWTGSCLVPVRRLRPQYISVTYPKQIRMEHLTQNAYAARNNGD